MEAQFTNNINSLTDFIGLSEERANEITAKIEILLGDKLRGKELSAKDFQETFNTLQEIAETPTEEVFMSYIFCTSFNQFLQFKAFKEMRNNFIASQLPHN